MKVIPFMLLVQGITQPSLREVGLGDMSATRLLFSVHASSLPMKVPLACTAVCTTARLPFCFSPKRS